MWQIGFGKQYKTWVSVYRIFYFQDLRTLLRSMCLFKIYSIILNPTSASLLKTFIFTSFQCSGEVKKGTFFITPFFLKVVVRSKDWLCFCCWHRDFLFIKRIRVFQMRVTSTLQRNDVFDLWPNSYLYAFFLLFFFLLFFLPPAPRWHVCSGCKGTIQCWIWLRKNVASAKK